MLDVSIVARLIGAACAVTVTKLSVIAPAAAATQSFICISWLLLVNNLHEERWQMYAVPLLQSCAGSRVLEAARWPTAFIERWMWHPFQLLQGRKGVAVPAA